jgi:hypothetical protein
MPNALERLPKLELALQLSLSPPVVDGRVNNQGDCNQYGYQTQPRKADGVPKELGGCTGEDEGGNQRNTRPSKMDGAGARSELSSEALQFDAGRLNGGWGLGGEQGGVPYLRPGATGQAPRSLRLRW